MGNTSSTTPTEEIAAKPKPADQREYPRTGPSAPTECPMHTSNPDKTAPSTVTAKQVIPSECPMHASNVDKPKVESKPIPSDCPMHASNVDSNKENELDPTNMMPPANQRPSPGQPFLLNINRQTSTIPRGGEDHVGKNWQYPSEQMFWNAMLRKGWRWDKDALSQQDMSHIIRIHNTNNERAWDEIMMWEAFHPECEQPKLLKFGGRAKDYSPRARFRALMGNDLPFDRHDWIIDRNGKPVRYIIDYYDIGDENGYKTGEFVELDVRPAFDSFGAAFDRSRVAMLRKAAGVYQWWKGAPEEQALPPASSETS